ncbi:MAG: hypothetical protein NC240_04670 [Clostridium sp.]|nr:hypothetical protein [Clostridium sp.]
MGAWQFIKNIVNLYWENSAFEGLFFFCLVLILIFENKKNSKIICIYTIIVLLFIFNPLAVILGQRILEKINMQLDVYYIKLFYLMPIFLVIAYGLTLLINCTEKLKKFFITIGVLLSIVLSGRCIFNSELYVKSDDIFKIETDISQILEYCYDKRSVNVIIWDELQIQDFHEDLIWYENRE